MGYICKQICCQELSTIAQSGHTELTIHIFWQRSILLLIYYLFASSRFCTFEYLCKKSYSSQTIFFFKTCFKSWRDQTFFQENDGLGDHEGLGTVKPVVDAIKLFFDEIFKNLVSPLDETTRILGHFKSNKQFKSKVLLKIELC